MEALRRLDLKPSFSYRAARDIRTLQSLVPKTEKLKREGIHHDALDDCIYQIQYCDLALKQLNIL